MPLSSLASHPAAVKEPVSEMGEAPRERRFLVNVERPWKLWIIPILALLYLVWIVLLVTASVETGVEDTVWVYAGLGLFAVLLLIELLLLFTRRAKKQKVARAAPMVAERLEEPEPEVDPMARAILGTPAAARQRGPDAEIRATMDEHKGKRVLEVSIPPKSANKGAVYAKAYVPVDDAFVLRIEDLVAQRAESG